MAKVREEAAIVSHKILAPTLRELVLKAPEIAAMALPGQFVHVAVGAAHILRRPISIADADAKQGTITLIYKLAGQGTIALADKKMGEVLDLIGPLGNSFAVQGEKILLVGGGIGTAPLIYLAKSLCPKPMTVVMGGRTAEEMIWPDYFKSVCQDIQITTDDGTCGTKGLCIDLLPEILTKGYDMIYTCGPKIMMEAVAKAAQEAGVLCQVSLEEYMACGVGACLSCTCAAKGEKRVKVCTDGPVFFSSEVMSL
ncbi:MAG: dihydroorotate dehydrogenase electron transfer subunit [Sporomusaceae bacterium]|nr:dihydroorotate dehydrogenase electron transfer subunit [Sporomusaceae bacterium]